MTSKERVQAALGFQKPDRVPFNFWMDRRLLERYEKRYGADFRITRYDADVIETFPLLRWPSGSGVERDGSYWFNAPLLTDWADADSLKLPGPGDEGVYDHIRMNLKNHPDRAIFVNIPGPFTVLHPIRLMDNLYYDVYDHPDELRRLIARIMDIQNRVIERVLRWPVTAIYFQDDIASSAGLLFSLPMVREFILGTFREGIAMAKAAGVPVVYHSDGAVGAVLDTLVDMGVRAVNPLQPEFNDFREFKGKYDHKLAVYGGIDNTKIIPDGMGDEIREHIGMIFDTLGTGGGLIMSSHDIPLHCPEANVDVMVQAIKECIY